MYFQDTDAGGVVFHGTYLDFLERARTEWLRALGFTQHGLMREDGEIKAYGSGLLSSYGELAHSVDSPDVQRYPIQLEWVINQYFEIDHYQPLLFVVDGFDHLFELVGDLEKWMKDGKLSNVSPGEPEMGEADVRSFIEAAV